MLVFILSLVAAIQIKFLKNVSGFQINLFLMACRNEVTKCLKKMDDLNPKL